MSMKNLLLLLLPLIIILTGCRAKAENPNAGYHSCNVVQGFTLPPYQRESVGYITSLKIGGMEGAADITVTDPINTGATMKVFGVLSWLTWREGDNDPVVFAAQVSSVNKDKLAALKKAELTGVEIEFSFSVYDYDLKADAYYRSVSSGTTILKGTLHKEGEQILFLVSPDSSAFVANPENFNFQLGVKGTGGGQSITITEAGGKVTEKEWGTE
jgi:hypothetical protein